MTWRTVPGPSAWHGCFQPQHVHHKELQQGASTAGIAAWELPGCYPIDCGASLAAHRFLLNRNASLSKLLSTRLRVLSRPHQPMGVESGYYAIIWFIETLFRSLLITDHDDVPPFKLGTEATHPCVGLTWLMHSPLQNGAQKTRQLGSRIAK